MKLIDKIKELRSEIVGSEVAENEFVKYQTNANDVEHTTNTWYGKELVPVDVLSNEIYNAIPKYATFLDKLPGFHGNNMGASVKVPVKWEVWFAQGNSEWTTWAGILAQWNNLLGTWDVTITQAPLIISVDISKKLVNHSIADIESLVIDDIARQVVRTAESMIINGDSSNASTWNVNCDDAVPSATFAAGTNDHRLLLSNGIRKVALDWTVNVDYKDVWTLEFDDYITVRALLWDYSYDLDNILLIMNGATYNKTLTLSEFKKQYQNWVSSVIVDWKIVNKLAWTEFVVSRDFGLTEADGKQSSTASSNTKGGFAYIYKPAIQYGYGQPVEIDVVKIPWKGYSVIATFEFGFAIVSKKAWQTSPSVALAINATV